MFMKKKKKKKKKKKELVSITPCYRQLINDLYGLVSFLL